MEQQQQIFKKNFNYRTLQIHSHLIHLSAQLTKSNDLLAMI